MMIEDEELRELYKTSSSEHLAKLESDLMILEKNPRDTAAIEEFLREAHTLKGDSRMLGLNDIEMLVHHLEDCVEGIKAGNGEITPELCDRLYLGIDAIERLSHQAITGEAVEVNTFEVLASLMGASDVSQSTGNSEADLFEDANFPVALLNDSNSINLFNEEAGEKTLVSQSESGSDFFTIKNSQPAVAAPIKDYSIETVRVEPQKLDTLMTHANELTVTKLRISSQMTEINQMLDLWEQWNKDNAQNRSMFDQIEINLPPEELQPFKLVVNNVQQRLASFGSLVNYLKIRANEDINSLNLIADRLEVGIQELRRLPLSDVFNLFPRMVRDLAKQQGKEINLVIEGGDTQADKKILEAIKDPLLHLIRNAIDHGIEIPAERIQQGKPATATLVLRGYQTGNSIGVEICDDGRGLNLDKIKQTAIRRQVRTEAELAKMSEDEIQSLIFASGFSTRTEITELSGRGIGLDVVRANVERLPGSIQVTSISGNGCKFKLRLGSSLVTTRVLIVAEAKNLYAIPVESIINMLAIAIDDIYTIDNSEVIDYENRPISLARLGTLLKLPTSNQTPAISTAKKLFGLVLAIGKEYFCLIVNAFVDRQNITLKPQSKLLKRIPNIAGATILGNGEVCMILNPKDLLHSLKNGTWHSIYSSVALSAKNKLLLVEDSMIIRTQMQRLLKNGGYDVTVAVNGLDGLQKIQAQEFDIVLSDIEMPQMNGLEMIANIRQNDKYKQLPIVLITTLASPEDKRRGMDAGANAYLTKGDFDQQILFQTLDQLVNHNN